MVGNNVVNLFQCPKRHEHEKTVVVRKLKRNPELQKRSLNKREAMDVMTPKDHDENRYYAKEGEKEEIVDMRTSLDQNEDMDDDEDEESIVPRRRPPIGTLPAFIPL